MRRSDGPGADGICATNAVEVNFDGIAGPTHNFSGLGLGNVASQTNAGSVSNPREAALAGLAKMRRLLSFGLLQGVLLPHARPHLPALRALGFRGAPEQMCADAWAADRQLFASLMSSSAMWSANAATFSPSADAFDGRVHVTPANLVSNLHRVWEAGFTHRQLDRVFPDRARFVVHDPLPGSPFFADEGAANHARIAVTHGSAGLELFVYGEKTGGRFPPRQTRRSCEALARLHRLPPERTAILQQSNKAIDAGAFHNDVMCLSNERVLILHEHSFEHRDAALREIASKFPGVELVEIGEREVPLEQLVQSYLLNSQLVSLPEQQGMLLVLPSEVQSCAAARNYVSSLVAAGTVREAVFVDVSQSMRNGGGPACLRLRAVLRPDELEAIDPRFLVSPERLDALEDVVRRLYPAEVRSEELCDPLFHRQALAALDALSRTLGFSDLYDFQRG